MVVITFWPHPAKVLRGKAELLQTLNQRLSSLRNFSDATLVLPFLAWKDLSPLEFLKLLRDNLNPVMVVVGEEFRFGRERKGDSMFLKKVLGEWGIEAMAAEKLQDNEGKISSSRIRALLKKGEVERANQLLCEPYTIEALRIKGEGRGRKLGFPTLNFLPQNPIVPSGIFAGLLKYRGDWYPAAVYVGSKPTFKGKTRGVEVHLLGGKPEVPQGEVALITFLKKIRDEKAFANENQLKRAIAHDIHLIKKYFGGRH